MPWKINRERFRGIIALIIATTLCVAVILVIIARIFGAPIAELTRAVSVTLIGALAAALATYLTTSRKP